MILQKAICEAIQLCKQLNASFRHLPLRYAYEYNYDLIQFISTIGLNISLHLSNVLLIQNFNQTGLGATAIPVQLGILDLATGNWIYTIVESRYKWASGFLNPAMEYCFYAKDSLIYQQPCDVEGPVLCET